MPGILAFGASDRGMSREENEDSFAVLELPGSGAPGGGGFLAVVADGMGGLEEGAAASRMAVEAVRDACRESRGSLSAALRAGIRRANDAIHARSLSIPERPLMGSTLTALAISGPTAWIAHVGDSRAYLVPRTGSLQRITRDHTLVEELAKRGDLDRESLHYMLHRSVLTRAVGLRKEVVADIVEVRDLEPGDVFILCSDGLHELVSDAEIESCARKRGEAPEDLVGELIRRAVERGGPDNITAVAVRIEEAGRGPADPTSPGRIPRKGSDGFPSRWILGLLILAAFALGMGAVLLLQGPLQDEPPRGAELFLEGILEGSGVDRAPGSIPEAPAPGAQKQIPEGRKSG